MYNNDCKGNNKCECTSGCFFGFGVASGLGLLFILFVFLLMAGCPRYNVWQQGLEGKAALKKADWDRQVQVQEAKGKMNAASLLANAEVERAKGVAKANKIIGQSLNNNEAYLRYLWIDHLQNEHNQVIYVPTEANLPILEANRFNKYGSHNVSTHSKR